MTAEITPAVKRAMEALATDQEHIPWAGHRLPANWDEHARAALATALDVEEMARVLDLHSGEAFLVTGGGQITQCPTCGEVPTDLASHQAAVLRADILGADS